MANVGIDARFGSQVRMPQMALTTGGSDYVLVSVWLPGPGLRLSRLRLPLDPTVGAKVRSHTRARLATLVSSVLLVLAVALLGVTTLFGLADWCRLAFQAIAYVCAGAMVGSIAVSFSTQLWNYPGLGSGFIQLEGIHESAVAALIELNGKGVVRRMAG